MVIVNLLVFVELRELCIRRKIWGKMPPGPQRFKSSQGLHYEVLDFHDTHSL